MSAGLFAALIAGAILLGGAAILSLVFLYAQARESTRLQHRLNPGGAPIGEFNDAGGQFMQTVATQGKQLEAMIDTSKESARLLMQAGWRLPHQRAIYYASQVFSPLLLVGIVGVLAYFGAAKVSKPILFVLMAVMAGMFGLLLPRMVLRSKAAARVRKIKTEVPLFIHLLVLLFEAGLSTRQAFASLVREGRGVLPELGREFELMLRQMEAGGETGELLSNLAASVDLEDLTNVLALLKQVDRYGGEVRDPLLETLKVIEERRSLDMRELVNLLSGRMTVVMVLFFFPALLIFVAGPAFISIIAALRDINT